MPQAPTPSTPVRTVLLARRVPVWSKGGTAPGASEVFVLSSEAIEQIAPTLDAVRVTMVVENATTDFQCRPVLQATDDAVTWGQPVDLDTDKVGDGTWTSDWHTTAADFRRAIRLGVVAGQANSATAVQTARVSLIADFRLKS